MGMTPTEHYWAAEKELSLADRTASEVTYLAALVHGLLAIEGHLRTIAETLELQNAERR